MAELPATLYLVTSIQRESRYHSHVSIQPSIAAAQASVNVPASAWITEPGRLPERLRMWTAEHPSAGCVYEIEALPTGAPVGV